MIPQLFFPYAVVHKTKQGMFLGVKGWRRENIVVISQTFASSFKLSLMKKEKKICREAVYMWC